MLAKVLSADTARTRWRDIMDAANAGGKDVIIARYGKPLVVVIPYEDYLAVQEELADVRSARDAELAIKEWEENPTLGKTLEEVKEELRKEGLLDA